MMRRRRNPVSSLPLPRTWRRIRLRFTLAMVPTTAITVVFGILSVTTPVPADREERALFLFMVVCTVFLAALTVMIVATVILPWGRGWGRGRGRPGTRSLSDGRTAVTFIGSTPLVIVAFYLFMACLLVFLLATPWLLENIPFQGQYREVRVRMTAPLMLVIAVYPAITLVAPLLWKSRRLGLGLSPEGLYYWSWFGGRFTAWDWISDIRAEKGGRIRLRLAEPRRRPRCAEETSLTRWSLFRKADQELFPGYLNLHPALTYYLVSYYFRHTEDRQELGTDAALDRIRRPAFGDLADEVVGYGDVRQQPAWPNEPPER